MHDVPNVFPLFPLPELELRPVALADAAELFALIDRNRDHLGKWLIWVPVTHTIADTEAFIRSSEGKWASREALACILRYQGRCAGGIGLPVIDTANRQSSIGYWLDRDVQGRGIATAACRALLDFCFRTLQLQRVELRAAVTNTRSRAVAERLGFVQEGILRRAVWIQGQARDLVVYGLLAEEWQGD